MDNQNHNINLRINKATTILVDMIIKFLRSTIMVPFAYQTWVDLESYWGDIGTNIFSTEGENFITGATDTHLID